LSAERDGIVCADALVFRCQGWTPDLAASGLSLIHLTVGRPHVGWDVVCDQIMNGWEMLTSNAEHLFPVTDVQDLDAVGETSRVGVIFGLQNGTQMGDQLGRVEVLWRLGIRVLQLTYNDANLLGDGCTEPRDAPLSRLGRKVVAECNRAGMIVDLSHVGANSCRDAIEASKQPVVATHSNRYALAQNPRNKPDDVLKGIAASGGVIGISPFGPMCWRGDTQSRPTVADFVDQIVGMVDLVGADAVAIGTDLPALAEPVGLGGRREGAAVQPSLDESLARFPEVFEDYTSNFGNRLETRYCQGFESLEAWRTVPHMLSDAGLPETVIRKVVAENWLRVCNQVWSGRNHS
jgi:membrane dipeptidase